MKILVISQHIFPIQTPRAHRTTELVKELSRKGHEVTVYAVLGKYNYSAFQQEFNIKVKNIPLRFQKHPYNSDGDGKRTLIDKILGRILRKTFEFPNIEFMLRTPVIIKKETGFDALITIADPHQIHWGAAKAKRKNLENFPKVWIADCGDPFMNNDHTYRHYYYFARLEKLFCKLCDYITVPVEEAKEGYYEPFRNKIKVIPQGFEFDLSQSYKEPSNEIITFAYAGTFYKDIRNPDKLLSILSSSKKEFKFVIFTLFTELITPFKELLGSRLEIRKPVKRDELIEELKKMDFLVNIENLNCPTQIPSKLIDYSLTGRPILSVNPIEPNEKNIESFLQRDYTSKFIVPDLNQYHISRVTDQFVTLISEGIKKNSNTNPQ